MSRPNFDQEHGSHYKPEVQNVIKLTLAFTKAVGSQQKDKSDNVVVSAYNAATALSMAAKGTDGVTKEEFAKTLFGSFAKDLDADAQALANLNERVLQANKGKVTLTTASTVWVNDNITEIAPAYAKDIKKVFDADATALDFTKKSTVTAMNKWASDNTNGLIDNIVDELKANDAMLLASALYFKGEWSKKFDKVLTEDKVFTQDGAKEIKVATMKQNFAENGAIRYLEGDDFEAVAMTYGEKDPKTSKNPSMRIVLVRPTDENVSARDWLAGQDSTKVPAWLDSYAFENVKGSVELPRLDMKQKHDLIPVLQSMGIKTAFTSASDFTPMTVGKDPLQIDKVTHDIVFKTDEEGSEGAAVTTVGMMKRSAAVPLMTKYIDIKLDRSFVFVVQDIETGAPVFAGVVNKPIDKDRAAPKSTAKAPSKRKPG